MAVSIALLHLASGVQKTEKEKTWILIYMAGFWIIMTWQQKQEVGNSVGVHNSRGSGSVGGCILLDDPEYNLRPRLCFLTCHHVVATADIKTNLGASMQPLPLVGMKSQETAAYGQMRSPSKDDYEKTLQSLKVKLDRVRQIDLKSNRACPRKPDRRLNLLLAQQQPIGSVIASSGIRVAECTEGGSVFRRKMDRAIVEFDDETRFNPIYAPDPDRVVNLFQGESYYMNNSEEVTEAANLALGQWVCMRGRTSGHASGTVNMIAMDVHDAGLGIGPHQEMIVVRSRQDNTWSWADFGDSGSFFYDAMGRVVALRTAELFPTYIFNGDYAGVTPIQQVFADIARQCGGARLQGSARTMI